MELTKVRLMKHRSLMIFAFLSLVFLSPMFVIGWEEPFETDTSCYIIGMGVEATNHVF